MNNELVLKELENLLDKFSIKVKYSRGYFKGGIYRYRDKKVLYLNKAQKPDEHIDLIVSEIRNLNIEGINQNPLLKRLLASSEII
jgi:hypothetical protein